MSLATEVGAISWSGTAYAQQAIIRLIGVVSLVDAVDQYSEGGVGAELARSVLRLLRPTDSHMRCIQIFREDEDVDRRQAAVELFRVLAEVEDLPLVDEFLSDPDPGVQFWGVGVVDRLLFSERIDPEAAEPSLRRAEAIGSPQLLDRVREIRVHASTE